MITITGTKATLCKPAPTAYNSCPSDWLEVFVVSEDENYWYGPRLSDIRFSQEIRQPLAAIFDEKRLPHSSYSKKVYIVTKSEPRTYEY